MLHWILNSSLENADLQSSIHTGKMLLVNISFQLAHLYTCQFDLKHHNKEIKSQLVRRSIDGR